MVVDRKALRQESVLHYIEKTATQNGQKRESQDRISNIGTLWYKPDYKASNEDMTNLCFLHQFILQGVKAFDKANAVVILAFHESLKRTNWTQNLPTCQYLPEKRNVTLP